MTHLRNLGITENLTVRVAIYAKHFNNILIFLIGTEGCVVLIN